MTDVVLAEAAWEGVDASVQALLDKWLVQPGDTVQAGQPLANVVLVKSNLEVVAPAGGRVAQLRVPTGATFGRGTVLATLA
jgi:pyruvate/2-oxoglutarate dehydrogenase complex dihydrolipoamide acyltransferase (E2) component